jgi:hypothetical protein
MKTRTRILIPLAAALLLVAVMLPGASAAGRGKTLTTDLISSFHGFVLCGVNIQQLGGVTCSSPALPHTELDGFALLRKHGKTKLGERGDSPFIENGTRGTLKKGGRWTRVGIVCVRKPKAVRCHNQDGHGIRLTPKSFKVF